MNDEFLYRLRQEPAPEFVAALKANLERQSVVRASPRRAFTVRSFVLVFLLGGSALAAALFAVYSLPVVRDLFVTADRSDPAAGTAAAPRRTDGIWRKRVPADHGGDPAPEQYASARPPTGDGLQSGAAPDESNVVSGLRADGAEFALAAGRPSGSVGATQRARSPLRIAGAATTYPLTRTVSETFISADREPPVIENLEPAAVFAAFCETSPSQPAIAVASRRITAPELAACRRNRAAHVVEAQVGYQALVITRAKQAAPMELSARDVFLALAKQVPDPREPTRLIANPNRLWSDVNPALDLRTIEVVGPAPASGLGQAFAGLVLEAGCDSFAWIESLKRADYERYRRICHTLRDDGAYVEAAQTYIFVTQKLWAEPNLVAIVDFTFYRDHQQELIGSLLSGVDPTLESVVAGSYPASRSIYIYMNRERMRHAPAAWSFFMEYLSQRASGSEFGYLTRDGLIPMEEKKRRAILESASRLEELTSVP